MSRVIIENIIGDTIGFEGLLMTDDLSMKALKGSYRRRAEAVLAAGIDVALHCNGQMRQMRSVVEGTPLLAGKRLQRAQAALARLSNTAEGFDVAEARSRFEAGLAAAA